jgi:Zn-dependent protease with chaperone function
MPIGRTAHYLDGRTATRHPVTLSIDPAALQIAMPDGTSRAWPYGRIRQTQGAYRGEPVRLECGPEPAEVLVIDDPALLSDIHAVAPALAQHLHNPAWRKARFGWTLCAGLGVVLILTGLFRWGIPGLAAAATPYVPASWEESLGRRIVDHLAPETQQCRDPERLHKINQIVQTLAATHPAAPYRISLSVVDDPAINAFAAPGGHVVILRGLLEQTTGPEQLAGVLAHELQHVYQRHTTRALLEQTAGTLLLTAVSGDLSGRLAWGLEGARTMGALHYSRWHEEEADLGGLRMMQAANLDPAAMIALYGTLQQAELDHAGAPDFLSTHPDMGRRLATLTALAGPPPTDARRLLPGEDWMDIRSLCRVQAARRSGPKAADLP